MDPPLGFTLNPAVVGLWSENAFSQSQQSFEKVLNGIILTLESWKTHFCVYAGNIWLDQGSQQADRRRGLRLLSIRVLRTDWCASCRHQNQLSNKALLIDGTLVEPVKSASDLRIWAFTLTAISWCNISSQRLLKSRIIGLSQIRHDQFIPQNSQWCRQHHFIWDCSTYEQ